jgi:murein DD-endopeptidase MepM/ murein hydrolase activator NlpD
MAGINAGPKLETRTLAVRFGRIVPWGLALVAAGMFSAGIDAVLLEHGISAEAAVAGVPAAAAAAAAGARLDLMLLQPDDLELQDWMLTSVADRVVEESYRFEEERETVEVASGDTLMGLLTEAEVPSTVAHAAVTAVETVFDCRTLQVGQPVTLVFGHHGRGRVLTGVELKPDVENQLVVERMPDGSFEARTAATELVTRTAAATGVIDSSLYEAATEAGVPERVLLAVIKAWSYAIDFQRDFQPGDRFAILYEEDYYSDGRFARTGKVMMAKLDLSGKVVSMYQYETEDGVVDYFDRDGKSVRRLLLRTPIDGARISSTFGRRRHPILGYTRMHKGVDFAAPSGTPIYAAGDGTVEIIERQRGYGKYIRLRHSGELSTAYAHLSRFARLEKGDPVRQGDVIGYVGSTGASTGPHLHYEVLVNDEQINPMSVDLPTGRTLEGAELASFRQMVERIESDFARQLRLTEMASNPAR